MRKAVLMYDSRAVANTILDSAAARGLGVTNLSLQKIIYFCHGWHMVVFGRPLVKQGFEAWQYGPVLQGIYREFKNFERRPIDARCTGMDVSTGERLEVPPLKDESICQLIDACVKFYGGLRPGTLVEMSHDPVGPWYKSWNHDGDINPGMRIDDSEIHEYFSKVARPF